MVHKNKNHTTLVTNQIALHLGVVVMLAATALNMVELAERESHHVAAVLQPNFAYASASANAEHGGAGSSDEMSRRAKEEIHHGDASYGSMRRSHSVTGSL